MDEKEKTVVLFSGGVDSTVLLYDSLAQGEIPFALMFDYGQKNIREVTYGKETCRRKNIECKVIRLPFMQELVNCSLTRKNVVVPDAAPDPDDPHVTKLVEVPNRNMIFAAIGVQYAVSIGAVRLYCGIWNGNFPDSWPQFFYPMREAITQSVQGCVTFEAPFLYLKKEDIIKKGIELGVDFSLTWSCYNSGMTQCGKCPTCMATKTAFEKMGVLHAKKETEETTC